MTWHIPPDNPPESGAYLVTAVPHGGNPDVWINEYHEGWLKTTALDYEIIAWDYLPEPYKGER